MAIHILLGAASDAARERIAQVLAEADGLVLSHVVSDGTAVQEALERDPDIDVVILDQNLENGAGLGVARVVSASFPLVGIAMLVANAGPVEFAAAMDSGARSVISDASSLSEMVSRIEAIAQWSMAARQHIAADLSVGRGGTVIAVAGAKGGVGTSVTALLLAHSLKDRRSVAIVDFDLQSGDLAAYSGVHTRRSVVDLVDIAGEMTGRVLRETSYDLEGGLRLISAPNEGENAEGMTAEAARAVVSSLRYQFDVSVIDVGSHLDDATAMVLEYADAALLVATPDLPALRAARRTVAMWERLAIRPAAAIDLVLNRRSPRSEVQEGLAQRIAEIPVALVLPEGGSVFESAMNTATILTATTAVHTTIARSAGRIAARHETANVGVVDPPPGERVLASGPRRRADSPVPTGRRGRERSTSRRGADAGQAAAELPVLFALGLIAFLLCAQGIVWGVGFILARNAADEGARSMSVGSTVAEAHADALDELTGPWAAGSTISVDSRAVQVSIAAPTVIPGLALTSSASAVVFEEPR